MKIYNKLVRDKIVYIIESAGRTAKYRTLDNNVEELADIVEVIYDILGSMNISAQEFEKVRLNKKEEKGGFEKKIYLEEAEEPLKLNQ